MAEQSPDKPHDERTVSQPAEFPPERVVIPPIDIFENSVGLVLIADVPGVDIESLDIQVQDNRLTILGRVGDWIPPGARLVHQEFEVSHFARSFILSDEVDHERISARLNHGVLEVELPHAPKSEPRRIQVQRD